MRYFLIGLLSTGCLAVSAQVQQITHQTFELSDSITMVELDIFGTYQVEPWAGNAILLETQVRLYNASQNILDHLLKIGRYELEEQPAGSLLRLVSKDKERPTIKTSKGECFEEVEQLIYIPEEFIPDREDRWRRPAREPETVSPSVDSMGTSGSGNRGN